MEVVKRINFDVHGDLRQHDQPVEGDRKRPYGMSQLARNKCLLRYIGLVPEERTIGQVNICVSVIDGAAGQIAKTIDPSIISRRSSQVRRARRFTRLAPARKTPGRGQARSSMVVDKRAIGNNRHASVFDVDSAAETVPDAHAAVAAVARIAVIRESHAAGSAVAAVAATGGIVLYDAVHDNRVAPPTAGNTATVTGACPATAVTAPLAVRSLLYVGCAKRQKVPHLDQRRRSLPQSAVPAIGAYDCIVCDHAVLKHRGAGVFAQNAPAIRHAARYVLTGLRTRRRRIVIRPDGHIRLGSQNPETSRKPDRPNHIAAADRKAIHYRSGLFAAVEVERTPREVSAAPCVNNCSRYNVRISRVRGHKLYALAREIDTVRIAYRVNSYSYENLVAVSGQSHSLLDSRVVYRNLQNAPGIRLKLDSHDFVAVHRYLYAVKIPARLVHVVKIPARILIPGKPACDPVARIGRGG